MASTCKTPDGKTIRTQNGVWAVFVYVGKDLAGVARDDAEAAQIVARYESGESRVQS